MTVSIRAFPKGLPMTDGGALTLDGAEALGRLVAALSEVQEGIDLQSPNGSLWRITVDDSGNLGTVPR